MKTLATHPLSSVCCIAMALLWVHCSSGYASEPSDSPVDFVRDIQPILSKHCYSCHGPKKQEGGIRWDQRASAIRPADSGHIPLVAGDTTQSAIIKAITSNDPKHRMPHGKPPLPDPVIALIEKWVAQGAAWPQGVDPLDEKPAHWSFVAPQKLALPEVMNAGWPSNSVDRFILSRLEREGLEPSREADRHTLIRRVSLDLLGLPPSPHEVRAFLNDPASDAYERLVDRLLNDPALGERWATVWLDLARYADSSGYGSDQLRPNIWPYRDWVINAFNRNVPFDRFTLEQLAGDLLPDSTEQQKIATAFHRNTMTNVEGGTDDEEFRVAAVKDRVNTTLQVWMGLTMGCAQCHTHKYDPITQREYYQFYAFFNQTADYDQPDERPTMLLLSQEQRKQLEDLDRQLAEVQEELRVKAAHLDEPMRQWEASLPQAQAQWKPLTLIEAKAESGAEFQPQDDGSLLVVGPVAKTDAYTLCFSTELASIMGLRLELLADDRLPAKGPGRGGNGNIVLNELEVSVGGSEPVKLTNASSDFSQGDFEVFKAVDGNPATGWAISPQMGRNHEAVFEVNKAKAVGIKPGEDLTVTLRQLYPEHPIGRLRLTVTHEPIVPPVIPPAVRDVLALASDVRSPQQAEVVRDYYRSLSPELRGVRERLAGIDLMAKQIRGMGTPIPVMRELEADQRRTSRVMIRGNFLAPGEPVEPAVPAAFGALSTSGALANRADVARWLVDKGNPLTARVTVNRLWSRIFGLGLVETEEDFGTQGSSPSHPELLDHLALSFQGSGWDVKGVLRLIVTSSTYRQSAVVSPALLERDPRNQLLARGPRFRLSAETVRDQAMALSGLISRKIGGPSVYPPQPEGLWKVAFNGDRNWQTSTREDRYRRGLYTFWRRTTPYPSMEAFDAMSREVCAIRRIRTNTPLQVFVTLNDPVYVEAAAGLARRLVAEGGATPRDRIRYGLELCLVRSADEQTTQAMVQLYEQQVKAFSESPSDARALAAMEVPGLPASIQGVTPEELAAWTVVANVLLNLDGVLTKG